MKYTEAIDRIFYGFTAVINPCGMFRNEKKLVNHKPEANNLHAFLGNQRSLFVAQ